MVKVELDRNSVNLELYVALACGRSCNDPTLHSCGSNEGTDSVNQVFDV